MTSYASLQQYRFRSYPAATSGNICKCVCRTRLAWLVSCVFKESVRQIFCSQILWGVPAVATCVITSLLFCLVCPETRSISAQVSVLLLCPI